MKTSNHHHRPWALRWLIPAVLSLLSLLGGCDRKSDRIKIGFVVKQPDVAWFQLEWKFAEEAARDFGFTLIKIGAPDGERVLTAIDSLAANGAQGMVICAADTRLGPAIVAKANAAGLKIISVDDQFLGPNGESMKEVHHLGISAYRIGENVGQVLWNEMKKRAWRIEESAVCAVTFDELATTSERTAGAIAALMAAGFSSDRIFRAPQRTTDIPGAFDATNVLLTQHPDVKHWLVCGINDDAVLGAVRALEGRGFVADDAIGVGINGTDCIIELEKERPTSFHGSILLSAKDHGYRTSEMMYKWIKDGVEPPIDTRTVGTLITRENFRYALREQGVRE